MINFSLNTCWRLIPTGKEQGESPAFFDGTLGYEPKVASSRLKKSRAKVLLFLMARWGMSQRPPHPDRKRAGRKSCFF